MKNFILIYCFLFLTMPVAWSQSAFQKKDVLINGGLSLIDYKNVTYDASERMGRSLPVFLSAEYGASNFISVGPFIGYYNRKYTYRGDLGTPDDDVFFKTHYTTLAIKSSFHFTPLLEDKLNTFLFSEDLDLYGSLFVGYEVSKISRETEYDLNYKPRLAIGASVGARYFINHRMALFGEVGPGILGLSAVGVTARF